MELLTRPTLKDRLNYLFAYILLAGSAVLGFLAWNQIRVLINALCVFAGYDRRGIRLVDRVGWIVIGTAWALYLLLAEHQYRTGVTETRIRRARAEIVPIAPPQNAFVRFLWKLDIDILLKRFLQLIIFPIIIGVIAYFAQRMVLQAILQ